MGDEELKGSIEAIQGLLLSLQEGETSEKLYKVSVYVQSVVKSWDACHIALEQKRKEDPEGYPKAVEARVKGFEASLKSSLRFARMNLDAAMVQALERIAKKPKNASKAAEKRKADALQKAFDRFPDPTATMLEHYRATSDPLDKYLVAGPWGHEYLLKRQIEQEHYYEEICRILSCGDSAAGRVVLSYSKLSRAIDAVEEGGLKALNV